MMHPIIPLLWLAACSDPVETCNLAKVASHDAWAAIGDETRAAREHGVAVETLLDDRHDNTKQQKSRATSAAAEAGFAASQNAKDSERAAIKAGLARYCSNSQYVDSMAGRARDEPPCEMGDAKAIMASNAAKTAYKQSPSYLEAWAAADAASEAVAGVSLVNARLTGMANAADAARDGSRLGAIAARDASAVPVEEARVAALEQIRALRALLVESTPAVVEGLGVLETSVGAIDFAAAQTASVTQWEACLEVEP